jgi:hypothetical protein
MVKQMKLKGTIQLCLDRSMKFFGKMYDGTPFDITVDQHDIQVNEEFSPEKLTVEGWCNVMQEAQQGDKCYLTLPKASIAHGKQILVNELQLMPLAASIADFRPQISGGIKRINTGTEDFVDIITEEFVLEPEEVLDVIAVEEPVVEEPVVEEPVVEEPVVEEPVVEEPVVEEPVVEELSYSHED